MSLPAFVRETLAWCNERRAAQGKPPLRRMPKGRRSDPRHCPIAKATGLVVTFPAVQRRDGKFAGRLPGAAAEFVGAFDDGELPQYEAKR